MLLFEVHLKGEDRARTINAANEASARAQIAQECPDAEIISIVPQGADNEDIFEPESEPDEFPRPNIPEAAGHSS
jgi:hypothetical protein